MIDSLGKDSAELKEKRLHQESNMEYLKKTFEERIKKEANELEQLMNEIMEENGTKIYEEIDRLADRIDKRFKKLYEEELVQSKDRRNPERTELEANKQLEIKETKATEHHTPGENRIFRRLIKPF